MKSRILVLVIQSDSWKSLRGEDIFPSPNMTSKKLMMKTEIRYGILATSRWKAYALFQSRHWLKNVMVLSRGIKKPGMLFGSV